MEEMNFKQRCSMPMNLDRIDTLSTYQDDQEKYVKALYSRPTAPRRVVPHAKMPGKVKFLMKGGVEV